MLLAMMALLFAGPSFFWWSLHGGSLGTWTRSEPEQRLREEWLRRHELTVAEARAVAGAARRGTAFTDPRLRAAAVEWGRVLLRPVPSVSPRGRRIWIWVGALGAAVSLVLSTYRVLEGRPEDLNWIWTAGAAVLAVWWLRRRSRIRRTIEVNGG